MANVTQLVLRRRAKSSFDRMRKGMRPGPSDRWQQMVWGFIESLTDAEARAVESAMTPEEIKYASYQSTYADNPKSSQELLRRERVGWHFSMNPDWKPSKSGRAAGSQASWTRYSGFQVAPARGWPDRKAPELECPKCTGTRVVLARAGQDKRRQRANCTVCGHKGFHDGFAKGRSGSMSVSNTKGRTARSQDRDVTTHYYITTSDLGPSAVGINKAGHVVNLINGDKTETLETVLRAAKSNWPSAKLIQKPEFALRGGTGMPGTARMTVVGRRTPQRGLAMGSRVYGDRRDYPKIDLFIDGHYVATTAWARTQKEAREKLIAAQPQYKGHRITSALQSSKGRSQGAHVRGCLGLGLNGRGLGRAKGRAQGQEISATERQYRDRERAVYMNRLRSIEQEWGKLPLAERRKEEAAFANDLKDANLIAERVGWLIDGSYGRGGYDVAREVLARPRMNREAWLVQNVGTFEWQVPSAAVVRAWKKLTPAEKAKLDAALKKVIARFEKEGE